MNDEGVHGGAAGCRGPRKRSNAQRARDLRRRAQLVRQRTEEARKERLAVWVQGKSDFVVERQDLRISELYGEKRDTRREVYMIAPVLEGDECWRRPTRNTACDF